jgi:hypothetical protein
MKYHQPDVEIPIRVHMELRSDQITVSVSNGISADQAVRYQAFVQDLQQGDAGDLLMRQQEESARSSEAAVSCLGLLTIITDYDAQSFDVLPAQPKGMTVTTSAVLPLKHVPGVSA